MLIVFAYCSLCNTMSCGKLYDILAHVSEIADVGVYVQNKGEYDNGQDDED